MLLGGNIQSYQNTIHFHRRCSYYTIFLTLGFMYTHISCSTGLPRCRWQTPSLPPRSQHEASRDLRRTHGSPSKHHLYYLTTPPRTSLTLPTTAIRFLRPPRPHQTSRPTRIPLDPRRQRLLPLHPPHHHRHPRRPRRRSLNPCHLLRHPLPYRSLLQVHYYERNFVACSGRACEVVAWRDGRLQAWVELCAGV